MTEQEYLILRGKEKEARKVYYLTCAKLPDVDLDKMYEAWKAMRKVEYEVMRVLCPEQPKSEAEF